MPSHTPGVHDFLRGFREALILARVRTNGNRGRSGLVDLEIQLVRPEEELQRRDERAGQAVGARRVVRIRRGLGSCREVHALDERRPRGITLRDTLLPSRSPSRIAVIGPPEVVVVLAVPHRDGCIGGREIREGQQPCGSANRELVVQGDEPDGFVPLRDEVSRPEPRQIGPSPARGRRPSAAWLSTAPSRLTSL